jgi:hypothetical protein
MGEESFAPGPTSNTVDQEMAKTGLHQKAGIVCCADPQDESRL